jgi:DNA-binding PadR family transcriptional regulator
MPRSAEPRASSYLPLKQDVFVILTLLAEEERHGYGIMQAAERWPGGGVEIQAGALYRRLKWMLGEGLIEEVEGRGAEADGDDRRRYYGITLLGREVARAEVDRMRAALSAVRYAEAAGDGAGA